MSLIIQMGGTCTTLDSTGPLVPKTLLQNYKNHSGTGTSMSAQTLSDMLCNPARTCYLSLTFMLFAYIKETQIFLDDFCGCVLMCNLNVPDLPLDECGVCSNAERWVSVCLN